MFFEKPCIQGQQPVLIDNQNDPAIHTFVKNNQNFVKTNLFLKGL